MFGQCRFAAATLALVVLGTACSSSGSPSPAPGGQSSAAGSTPAAGGATSPAAGVSPPVGSVPGSGGGGCKLSASEVSAAIGVEVQDGMPNGIDCTYATTDGTAGVTIITTPSAEGDEETVVAAMGAQFTDLEPIPGEEHAYSVNSVGEVIYFANGLQIIIGSSNLDDAHALALAKLYAG